MWEFNLEKVDDTTLRELLLPITSYFGQFISSDKQLVLKKSINNDKNKDFNAESQIIHFKKNKKKIELIYSNEYLEKRVIEIKNKSIINYIKELNRFSIDKDYKILQSLSYSLLTNVTQFVEYGSKFMTAIKWRKIFYSYISLIFISQDIKNIEFARTGISTKKIILSLGLIDQTPGNFNASNEIQLVVDLSKQSNNYIVVPVYGCSSQVFSRILKEYSKIDILHIAGHGINLNNNYYIQFSDCDMRYSMFCDTLMKFNHSFDLIFLNCCHSYDFVLKKKVRNSKETIVHNKEVGVTVALDFANHYFIALLLQNNSSLTDSWNLASQNCSEKPLEYYRLQ